MFVPLFILHGYLESTQGSYVAVIATLAAAIPGIALWHYYYAKYS